MNKNAYKFNEIICNQDRQGFPEFILQMLDGLEEGVVIHDQDRRIFLMNRAAEQITGWRREEALGKNCHTVFTPDGICGSHCPFQRDGAWPEPGRVHSNEVGFFTRQGEEKRLALRVQALKTERAQDALLMATFRDITEVSQLRFDMQQRYSFHGMVGRSPAMGEVFRTIRQLAGSDYPVLITGDSGTGKELVARAIHNESRRQEHPFVPINCGALPENILESELFGHVRGAFTGAIRDKKGRFSLADQGTLFLDEVGELSPAFQVKLLRVLQEQRFEPVGGEQSVTVNVRVVAATNRDLKQMVDEGSFRQDLFYRLSVVPVHLPSLKQRREDLPGLTEQILERVRADAGKDIRHISDGAMDKLMAHDWPGNVRELINALQFASVRCPGEVIETEHLPPELRGSAARFPKARPPYRGTRGLRMDEVELALAQTEGNKLRAAKLLGIGRATLYRFLEKQGKQP